MTFLTMRCESEFSTFEFSQKLCSKIFSIHKITPNQHIQLIRTSKHHASFFHFVLHSFLHRKKVYLRRFVGKQKLQHVSRKKRGENNTRVHTYVACLFSLGLFLSFSLQNICVKNGSVCCCIRKIGDGTVHYVALHRLNGTFLWWWVESLTFSVEIGGKSIERLSINVFKHNKLWKNKLYTNKNSFIFLLMEKIFFNKIEGEIYKWIS